MTRRRKTLTTAFFTYGQAVLGMTLGLIVTRLVLQILGRDTWGLWVASGALLAYANLADLGVLGVLSWVIADSHGRKEPERIRAALSQGIVFALIAAAGFILIAGSLWQLYPEVLHLTDADRKLLRGPVLIVVALSALNFPVRLFSALLTGLQDVTFLGITGLAQTVGSSALTLTLARMGFGLYSLALGTGLPPVLAALAASFRARISFRMYTSAWPAPTLGAMRGLAIDGLGTWLGTIGFQLAAAADPVILASLGLRTVLASFALTTRLPMMLMQLGWILPDSALVALAELGGEAPRERVREVVLVLLRLNLVIGGAVATAILASNGGFIRVWVGSDLYLGTSFNALLAANAVLMTAVHGLASIASVFGKRMRVGTTFVANGVVHIVLASALGHYLGPTGVAAATFVSGVCTALPVCAHLLTPATGITARVIVSNLYWPWLRRYLPIAGLALALGRVGTSMHIAILSVCCAALGIAYLWWMKPLLQDLPFGARLTPILRRFRFLSQTPS